MDNYALQYQGQEIDALLQKIDDLDVATDESSGLMSAQDKSKLDEIESGAEENLIETIVLGDQSLPPSGSKTVTIPMDDVPAMGSNNPVKSSGVYAEIADIKEVIPTTAAPGNKLTPKSQVDALIATALLNYYLKSETYSKSEINALIAGIKQFTYQVVDSLPTASADTMYIVYFVPSSNPDTQNVKDEYITIESNGVYSFEQIGSTSIDISGKADKDTDAVAGNLAKFDSNGNPVDAGIAAEKVAQKGEIQTYSGNLVDTRSAGTAQEFTYRKSGGDGVNWMRRIKGKSLVWNQLINRLFGTQTNNGISISSDGNEIVFSGTGTNTNASSSSVVSANFIVGHKYYYAHRVTANPNNLTCKCGLLNQGASAQASVSNVNVKSVFQAYTTGRSFGVADVMDVDVTGLRVMANLIDLTLLFGEGKEPSTVAEFEALYNEPYYPYQPGVIKNNDAETLETVGFNQWDEEWEVGDYNQDTGAPGTSTSQIRSKNASPIRVFGNTSYCFTCLGARISQIYWYDEAGNFISRDQNSSQSVFVATSPTNARYCKFQCPSYYGTTYNNDICINISDASRNGTYEPYWKKSIQLGLNSFRVTDGTNIITVNGLKSAGPVYDEIYPVRKKHINRIEEVDLGTLTWTYYTNGYFGGAGLESLIKKAESPQVVPDGICAKYALAPAANIISGTSSGLSWGTGGTIVVRDSAYTDAVAFKAAMNGVPLYFALATPVEYDLVDDIPNAIEVDENGTERAIFPEADDPSAPFAADSNYSVSTADLVRKLNYAS